MTIDKINDLQTAVLGEQSDFLVKAEAFDFCDQILQSQVTGSGNDWSITATNGWMAIITGFNHKIHRLFMKQERKDNEDLRHQITKKYIIRKTELPEQYKLILRKK
ncbi:hypothetical protein [Companilactobacillus halodurans]|uniref:Uncharacterized protein n=1 Tax=Companilactobacillus halodurans TaxID=2584183 RepID=A0A5P0ZXL6_9LACO|nr:hypothetical protein [Companilactobacillus halodurans]MQS75707.1 hypothetical protein [Companilactobacillus halodurans]MQS97645.1 hypothetical protein [Companilactobacillus halodurans]